MGSSTRSLAIKLLMIQCLTVVCFSQDFDFFYFVQQWPGSYCDLKQSCCYPSTGKPASDFGIHGLWPNYQDGSYPQNCDPDAPLDPSKISDLKGNMQKEWPTLACPSGDGLTFWGHEWTKHGTCSESVLDQHDYFATTLHLKDQVNLLQSLERTGYTPFIECNVDASGNSQLYQVYLCLDNSASKLIECPVFPHGKCGAQIQFPTF
ncbi:hypothetical protein DCAR_0208078 [Daucus carota subsp. sativus]|uniref:Uncharacterized protein n=1 Tax=Daucus carota subsp. sativus TaxID=79200 RepID=A0AAF1AN48_DAUCS|nr:hypothetical protein DCAR_0208078 [Daucus carota subsp. sativus]